MKTKTENTIDMIRDPEAKHLAHGVSSGVGGYKFVAEIGCAEDHAYRHDTLLLRAVSMVRRAFESEFMGAGLEALPPFDKGNVLRVTVEVAPA